MSGAPAPTASTKSPCPGSGRVHRPAARPGPAATVRRAARGAGSHPRGERSEIPARKSGHPAVAVGLDVQGLDVGHLLAAVVKLAFLAVLGAARLEGELAVLAVAGDGIAVEAVDALAVEGELALLAVLDVAGDVEAVDGIAVEAVAVVKLAAVEAELAGHLLAVLHLLAAVVLAALDVPRDVR